MQPTTNTLSEKVRTQSAELLKLADAIDLYGRAQQARLIVSGRLLATPGLFDKAPSEDYSDLSPNAPPDPDAWRGAQFRRLRNAAIAGDNAASDCAYAGHGRGAPE